jgi:hypothetical protein
MKSDTFEQTRKRMKPVCKHCCRFANEHVSDHCVWAPTKFEPACCEGCKHPFLFMPDPIATGVVNVAKFHIDCWKRSNREEHVSA